MENSCILSLSIAFALREINKLTYYFGHGSIVFSTTPATLKCIKILDIYFSKQGIQTTVHVYADGNEILQTWTFSDRALNFQ